MQSTSLSPFPVASDRFLCVGGARCPDRHRHPHPTRGSLDLSNGLAFFSSTILLFAHTPQTKIAQVVSGKSCYRIKNREGRPCRLALGPIAQEISDNKTNGAITMWPSQNESLGIVITGGTKGLGFALAREFLELNDRVIICGRHEKRLSIAVSALQQEIEGAFIDGILCDVSNNDDVERLAQFATKRLGVIDRWLNNAGEITAKKLLADVDADEIIRVSRTNVVGSLLCCREAIRLMREQGSSSQPMYHIFNMGFSQWGAKFTKSACTHKATKIALTQLTESLSEELKTAGISSIGVHNLSPGLVLTDLLLKDSTPIARRFFNTLAEEPETVAEILAPRIRAVQGSGQSLDVLSPLSAFFKVVTGFPQILFGGRFFDKDGNRVVVAGKTYHDNGVKVIY
ncbi:unnamed protein product [Calypogeia fissa]